eukprot:TRINITY_DN38115_c0_g2_i1.p1 TRINITY_DN38115_c0_g2~~TRINITY_DN38115_c0_g2_i1.p1  ORF type:complete len:559 (-),score=68.37 TRINITY_DN38115_c0_g2_i1:101-1777(-)
MLSARHSVIGTPRDGTLANAATLRGNFATMRGDDGGRTATPQTARGITGDATGPRSAWHTPREGPIERGSTGTADVLKAAGLGVAAGRRTASASGYDRVRGGSGGGGGATPRRADEAFTLRRAAEQAAMTEGLRIGADVASHVAPAGKAGVVCAFTRTPLDEVILPTPRTPENFGDLPRRHRRRTGPQEITVHWGLKNCPIPDPGDGYGAKSAEGEDVAQNFKAGQLVGIAEYINMRGESIYRSTVEEPLGRSFSRGHALPSCSNDADFPGFGKPTPRGPVTAKEAVFPRGGEQESDEVKELYKRTHANYAPGEMSLRKYQWPRSISADPHFRFGMPEPLEPAGKGRGAKKALSADCEDHCGVPLTKIVKLKSEDYRHVTEDRLALGKNLKQGRPPVPSSHAFGAASGPPQPNAAELLHGWYSHEEQLPDRDLGRCTVPGRRNYSSQMSMGVPSIRRDKPALQFEKRSVANCTNFGDDLQAYDLICPNKFQVRGVTVEDFQIRRSESELRRLFEGAGGHLSPGDFEELFSRAAGLYKDGSNLVSLEVFMSLYSDSIGT